MCRFVKTIQRLDLGDALRVHALRAPVAEPAAFRARAARPRLGFGHVLFDRAARHKLDHRKSEQQDAEQRGQHEQEALEDVGKHIE